LAVLATKEAAVAAREDQGLRAEQLRDGERAAVGHLVRRLRARGHDDAGRSRPQCVDVRLEACGADDVLTQQRVGARAVVLCGQPERRRVRHRLAGQVGAHRASVAHGGDELRHTGTEPAAQIRVMDGLGDSYRALAIRQDRREWRLVRDERQNLLGVLRHEGERVHRAAAGGEQVDRPCLEVSHDLGDDPMQVVGVLLGR
jgi:hypothetical protein